MTRATLRLGAAVVVLYAVVAVATGQVAPGRLRPLFDGFASHPGVYNWVKPPKEFAEGNVAPQAAGQARIAFAATGSTPVLAETPDGQAMVSLPPGAVPPHPSAAAATVDLLPVDSNTLGALPAGLRPEGNAYRVTIAYLPSGDRVPRVTTPGRVGVTSEAASDTLLFSVDGRSWSPLEAQPIAGGRGLTGPFTEPGYVVPAGRGARRAASFGQGPPVVLFVVAAAVPLILGYLLLGRRRGTAAPPPSRGGRGRPAAKKPQKKRR